MHAEMAEWCRGRWWFPRFLFLAWFAYMLVRYLGDPAYHVIFSGINLGIHEIGHILWSPFGEFMAFLGGSLTQCLAPVVSVFMFYRQRDFFGIAFCFGWLSTNLHGVSVYAGDARAQALPLVTPGGGHPLHDWHYLLSRLGLLEMDQAIALLLRGLGVLSMLVFLVLGSYQCWLMFRLPKKEHELEKWRAKRPGWEKSSMKTTKFLSGMLVIALCIIGTGAQGGESEPVSLETVDELMQELSNWGKWGKDDEMGALNYITPETRKAAAKLVREGVSVSLAHDVEMVEAPDVSSPFVQKFKETGATSERFVSDQIAVDFHGYAHTHMDSLCHMFAYGKYLYNGYPKETLTEDGAEKLAVLNFKNGIFARGILMDIPRLKGVPYLEPREAIYPADLEAWEKKAGFKVGKGDVVIFNTGRWARRAEKGPWDVGNNSAGLHISCMKWLADREVAMVGSDAAMDILPSPIEGLSHPIHQLTLIAIGMPIFDNLDLVALSAEAQRQGRWEFLLTAAPLAVPGGTGSPLNPIATF